MLFLYAGAGITFIVALILFCLTALNHNGFIKIGEYKHAVREYKKLIREYHQLKEELHNNQDMNERLTNENKNLQQLVDAKFEAAWTKKVNEFDDDLKKKYAEMEANSDYRKAQDELENLAKEIADAKRIVNVWNEKLKDNLVSQEYASLFSIQLSDADLQDIGYIKQIAGQLNRREAFYKLIWTEFYQRPLQKLCKDLDADKKCGIYMIANTVTNEKYIGQSRDIGTRWKEHVKTGLGIGSTANLTNKLYKSISKYGPEHFAFSILEECSMLDLNEREKYWIDFLDTINNGLNSKAGGQ